MQSLEPSNALNECKSNFFLVVFTFSDPPSTTDDKEDGTSREYEILSPDVASKYPIRFAVRSLGWVPIAEDQLTQELSSRAVNQCIVKLSGGLRDVNDVVGRWGDVSNQRKLR